ncbi:MAG: cell division protein ZapA [Deltaproteobacteria bacterium]|nr:cell division protein ZapA [Deltaproteobacteria bacterium]
MEQQSRQEVIWYDIQIAGKKFKISSRLGEAHIREVERLVNDTYGQIKGKAQGQPSLNLAMLTALNLAEQMLALKNGRRDEWNGRLEQILHSLDSTLEQGNGSQQQSPQAAGTD